MPPVNFQSLANEWQFIDNLEAITYFVKTSDVPPTTNGITVQYCLRRAQGKTLSDNHLIASLTWHIWAANLPQGVVPKFGDVIQDQAGNRWVIDVVNVQTLSTRYRLDTRKEVS